MKKVFVSIVLSIVLMMALILPSAAFASDNDRVEISFKVGESILMINGVATEVETPYVVGEGTTLVPLRVITEAFGAQVDWENETQTVTLTYPSVNIKLQIDNIVATVNDHSETLFAAPVLSENGVTMIPLRFISETFGADVSYEDETEAILVTKQAVEEGSTVTGITDMKYTGDSYYNWSIETPSQMKMTDRRLDGLETLFADDHGNEVVISIYNITEDSRSFDETFAVTKNSLAPYTLINAEKLTDKSGNPYMHFQAKDKKEFIDYREYHTKKYQYCVASSVAVGAEDSVRDSVLSIANSFKIGSIDNQTFDLSTVHSVNGTQYRTITDEDYKVTFEVPAHYTMNTSKSENEFGFFDFTKNSNAYIILGIYSKTDTLTAKLLAEGDCASRKSTSNPEFVTISDVTVFKDGSYRYTQTISGSSHYNTYTTDCFFENGDYVYNFAIVQNGKGNESEMNYILNSLKTEKLDSAKIGKILRNDSDETDVTVKVADCKVTLPAAWKVSASSPSEVLCMHDKSGSGILVSVVKNAETKRDDLKTIANEYKNFMMDNTEKATMEEELKFTTINDKRFAYFTYKIKDDKNRVSYTTTYMTCENGRVAIFSLLQSDISYQSKEIDTFLKMLSSFDKQ